jgi:hypothetical protein
MARSLSIRGRFAVAYLVLGAAVGATLGGFIVLAKRPAPKPAPPWSSWQPGSSSRDGQVLEIASHVGSRYRLASGDQLNAVKIGPPDGTGSVRAIAVPKKSPPKTLGDFTRYDQSKNVIYVLCGAAKNCSITEGKPSNARGAVLRREALELALYTFKYEDPVDNVLVFFPPSSRKAKLSLTLFFHRDELDGRLEKPLRSTLPQALPPLPGKITDVEQQTVDALTGSSLYRYITIGDAPGYGSVLVVQPVA